MTRNFKASASNMTQGGTFNISAHNVLPVDVPSGTNTDKHGSIPVATWIAGSDMHKYLSYVFDQYRIERVVIRCRPIGDSSAPALQQPSILYSCIDRSGFENNVTITSLRTYGSYKETAISGAKDVSPVHTIYMSQSSLVEWTTWTDSKKTCTFPACIAGVFFAFLGANSTVNLSIEIDAQIRYRGVRLDTSQVN